MAYKRELLDRIRSKVDIVEYIGDHVDLVRRGDSYLGLCPFHADTHPSMRVHPGRGIFKCFACGEGGSVITFAMKYHEISFTEAVELLAELAKVPLPTESSSPRTKAMLDFLKSMTGVFTTMYKTNHEMVDQHIHFPDEVKEKFIIGLAPDRYAVSPSQLAWEIGLINEEGHPYFQKRIMFPIRNASGQVVGFYGRAYEADAKVKHLISKNSRVFRKSDILYGFYEAKKAIRETKTCYLVEGPKDCLAYWSIGIQNVVATCGTTLSRKQAMIIASSANTVIMAYDSDEAGFKAALKNTEQLLEADCAVRYLVLPMNQDPYDCWIKEGSIPSTNSVSLPAFLTLFHGTSSAEEKVEYTKAFLDILSHTSNTIYQSALIDRAAAVLKLSANFIWDEFSRKPFRLEMFAKNIISPSAIKSESWHQLVLGLSYAPVYCKDVLKFLEGQLGDYSKPREVIKLMIDSEVREQAQWIDTVNSYYLSIPTSDEALDMMSVHEIMEYIEIAARTLVGSNLIELLKKSIATGDTEGTDRIRLCMDNLQSTKILDV